MNLAHEFLSYVDAIDEDRLDHLKSIGVTGKAIARAGLVGAARIETENNGWQPEESGKPSLIVPVGPTNGLEGITDLIAIQTSNPHTWWVRTGLAPLLGYESLAKSIWYGSQLTIHSNPLDWLRAECDGVVILDWHRYLPMWLSGVTSIYCPDPVTGNKLSGVLTRNLSVPEIRVGEIHHAA